MNHPLMAALRANSTYDWVWVAYLAVVFAAFGVLEGIAMRYGHDTLSAWVWRVTAAWPPFGWLVGVVVGFLAAHFFWPHEGL
jgi:phage shock protein PspC (stress-responsive transcriptional regulator)